MSQPPSTQSVDRDAHEQRRALGPHRADRGDHLAQQARAIVERAAVFVVALIAQRRQELVNQIAVRRVDLDHANARFPRAPRARGESGDDFADAVARQRLRHRIVVGERQRARRHDLRPSAFRFGQTALAIPRPPRARLASGVRELHAGDAALRMDEARDPRERLDVRVAPDAEILRTDPPLGQDRRRLGDHQPRAAHRAAAKVDEVPVVREPIHRRVLAHRRHEHAIGKSEVPDAKRVEELRCVRHTKIPRKKVRARRFRAVRSNSSRLSAWINLTPRPAICR